MQLAAEKPAANNAKRQREISRNNEKLVVVVVVSRERVHETEMKEIFFVLLNFCLATMLRKRRSEMRDAGREFNLLKTKQKA